MEAKVIRWGDDLAVRLSSAEAEELGIREDETVEIVSKRPPAARADAMGRASVCRWAAGLHP